MTPDIARALVIGGGSAGRRHLQNLRRLVPRATLTCWKVTRTPGHPDLASLADRVVFEADAALSPLPALAVVAGPATTHAEMAITCLAAGVPTLIEKPIAADLADAGRIAAAADAAPVPILVGYTLRFYPPLVALAELLARGDIGRPAGFRAEVGQYLPDWRPGTDWRTGVSARAALGGGALLELSHEFDYARWLMGDVTSIAAVAASGSLDVDVEDCVDVVCRFTSGASGSLHFDFLQRPLARTCRIVGGHGVAELDLVGHRLRKSDERGNWHQVGNWPAFERNDMFLDEMRHFLSCVAGGEAPRVTVDDGCRALVLALAAREAARTSGVVHV